MAEPAHHPIAPAGGRFELDVFGHPSPMPPAAPPAATRPDKPPEAPPPGALHATAPPPADPAPALEPPAKPNTAARPRKATSEG